jgi:hypothetical protein
MRATRVLLFSSSLELVPFFLQACNELIDRCISCQFSTSLEDLRKLSEPQSDCIYVIDSTGATLDQIFDLAAAMHRLNARAALFLNRPEAGLLPPGLISQRFLMMPPQTTVQDIVDFIFNLDVPWVSDLGASEALVRGGVPGRDEWNAGTVLPAPVSGLVDPSDLLMGLR